MSRAGRASRWQLRRLRPVALAICAGALIAACGGGGHSAATQPAAVKMTPASLVAQTFSSTDAVRSGRVALHLSLTLDGVTQLGGKPATLDLAGPFSSGSGGTATDLSATVSAASSTAALGLVLSGKRAYLGIDGTFYELALGSSTAAALGASGASGAAGMLSSLGINPRGWLSDPQTIGQVTVGGVATTHIRAQVNIANLLGDLSKVTGGGSTGATGASGSSSSTSATILALVESAVTNATVDIYTGDNDHIVRRFDLAIAFTVPSIAAGALGGLTGGSLALDVTLTDLGRAETITAPANAQPTSKLLNGVFALESRFGALAPLLAGLSPGA